MTNFRLCYDPKKHTSDWDSILELHSTSWVITVIEPLLWVNIYGIVTSP
jgi:hypothetical protein